LGNPYQFTSRRWDAETGLYYYRFRDYAPELGRFVQCDPLQYIDGMNMYAYCGNNPVNWRDPWGLSPNGIVYPGYPTTSGGERAPSSFGGMTSDDIIRSRAASWAEDWANKPHWRRARYDPDYPLGRQGPKCNLFVAHAYKKQGNWVSYPKRDNGKWYKSNMSYPLARELANESYEMPHYRAMHVSNKDCLKRGDIITNGTHAAIYVGNGEVVQASSSGAGVSRSTIEEAFPGGGPISDLTIRRYYSTE